MRFDLGFVKKVGEKSKRGPVKKEVTFVKKNRNTA